MYSLFFFIIFLFICVVFLFVCLLFPFFLLFFSCSFYSMNYLLCFFLSLSSFISIFKLQIERVSGGINHFMFCLFVCLCSHVYTEKRGVRGRWVGGNFHHAPHLICFSCQRSTSTHIYIIIVIVMIQFVTYLIYSMRNLLRKSLFCLLFQ